MVISNIDMPIYFKFLSQIPAIALFCTHAHAQIVAFPTADKSTTLNVLVEYPSLKNIGKYPVVVFGGGLFADRDDIFNSGDAANDPGSTFLFGQLSQRFKAMGFIVVQYDQRGINGNMFTFGKGVKLCHRAEAVSQSASIGSPQRPAIIAGPSPKGHHLDAPYRRPVVQQLPDHVGPDYVGFWLRVVASLVDTVVARPHRKQGWRNRNGHG